MISRHRDTQGLTLQFPILIRWLNRGFEGQANIALSGLDSFHQGARYQLAQFKVHTGSVYSVGLDHLG